MVVGPKPESKQRDAGLSSVRSPSPTSVMIWPAPGSRSKRSTISSKAAAASSPGLFQKLCALARIP